MLSENTGVKVLASHSMARTQSWRDDVRNGMSALILQNKGKIAGHLGLVRRRRPT